MQKYMSVRITSWSKPQWNRYWTNSCKEVQLKRFLLFPSFHFVAQGRNSDRIYWTRALLSVFFWHTIRPHSLFDLDKTHAPLRFLCFYRLPSPHTHFPVTVRVRYNKKVILLIRLGFNNIWSNLNLFTSLSESILLK